MHYLVDDVVTKEQLFGHVYIYCCYIIISPETYNN